MGLEEEVRSRIRRFLDEEIPVRDLRDWLLQRARLIDQTEDEQLIRLTDRARIILYELSDGYRDEADARQAFAELLLPNLTARAGRTWGDAQMSGGPDSSSPPAPRRAGRFDRR